MIILNLGCGNKTSSSPEVINIDSSFYLRLKQNKYLKFVAHPFLSEERRKKLDNLPDNIVLYNLKKGIPYPNNTVDVVYHSHLFEHLDRDIAEVFQREIFRVLKPGGIQRIVVPDFEMLCKNYLSHVIKCESNLDNIYQHDSYIAAMIEQSVRKEAFGASEQSPLIRKLDNYLFGDARERGESHQWMYDRFNLQTSLKKIGFNSIKKHEYKSSDILGWSNFGLDLNANGNEYKVGSLYIEAVKPE